MSSVFAKIVAGEIPCYKIYEDEKVLAFLDIHPGTRGHTLVIPKIEVDKIYDLPEDEYVALMLAAKKIAKHMEEVFHQRTLWKVVGTDVPHAHIHLEPYDENWYYGREVKMTPEEMQEVQAQLKMD